MDVFPLIPGLEITKSLRLSVVSWETPLGIARRRTEWVRPMYEFALSFPGLEVDKAARTIFEFWTAQFGRLRPFKFKYPEESFEGQPCRLVSDDGTTQVWQCQVKYGEGYESPLVVDQELLVNGSLVVKVDGVEVTASSVDYDLGQFSIPSTAGTVTADWERYYKVIFGEDRLSVRAVAYRLYSGTLTLVEVI